MRYSENYERDAYDPSRNDAESLDDRDEAGVNIYDDAGWNDENDPVAHL
jgi:hypothetical protein